MLTVSHASRIRSSLGIAALIAVVGSLSANLSLAADDSPLVDEGISQIVTDEVADRLAQYLEAYGLQTVQTVVVEGKFRSLSNEALSQQLTDSLKSRKIVIDEDSGTTLTGQVLLSESEEAVLVLMHCTLSDVNNGDLCTVRIRKVLTNGGSI